VGSVLERGREAYRAGRWSDALQSLEAAPADRRAPDDWERLAVCAYLTGRDEQSATAWESAYAAHLRAGDPAEAARCAFWLALGLLFRGQAARANGWLSRCRTTLDEAGVVDCPARGYLLVTAMLGALGSGDAAGARDMAVQAATIGERHSDHDLHALGTLGHGQTLLALGETAAGTAKLDEAMVAVAAGEVGPVTTGIVYCAVVVECMSALDLARATEWTTALSTWCEGQPDLVPYRGQCLVHRSQLQQAHGDWGAAVDTADAACRRLVDPPHPALGLGYYQQGELHRVRGEVDQAAAAYRRASRAGHEPQPGLALLELSRGTPDAAAQMVRRALLEVRAAHERTRLLGAAVEILAAVDDVPGAARAADELDGLASGSPSGVLRALSEHSRGAVLLAGGDPAAALGHLRAAATTWRQADLPYELARTTALVARCCARLGDQASAALEADVAVETFLRLGARHDADATRALTAGPATRDTSPLSGREREVLAQVAAGRTNREIAAALVISEHTVGRHLENIFAKLAVSSRAAAAAYGVEHGLV
jgi:DNA-binding CsgD family transcriptional regulator